MSRYISLVNYDGTLTGRTENPAGPYDIASPGGLATIQHHWTGGMFGIGDRTYDVYAGTGDRYPYGEYGNLYRPDSHADVHKYYVGPYTSRTEYHTIDGEPYFWQEKNTVNNKEIRVPDASLRESRPKGERQEINYRSHITSMGDRTASITSSENPAKNSINGHNSGENNNISLQNRSTNDNKIERFETNVNGAFDLIEPVSLSKTKGKPIPLREISTILSENPTVNNLKTNVIDKLEIMKIKIKNKIYYLIFILILIFIISNFWTESIHKFLDQKIYNGKTIPWTKYTLYTIIITIILIFIIMCFIE
jgi:hypothetical protein